MKAKSFWKTKGFKSYIFTTIPLSIIVLTAGIVLTSNSFLYNTLNQVFGTSRRKVKSGDPSKYQYFKGDYDNKEDVLKAANQLNEEIVAEGITLLKNVDNSLPLKKESKITVFGKNSTNLVLGGSGSNASSTDKKSIKTIYDSLNEAGFKTNPLLKEFYLDNSKSGQGRPTSPDMNSTSTGLTGFPIGETEANKYTDSIKKSFKDYNDAAIVVLSRIGGEGFDLPRSMKYDGKSWQNWDDATQKIPGARDLNDHYLQLDQNETDMIKLACDNFKNVVVVINSPSPLELGFLDDPNHYAYNQNIKGALWIGTPGNSGIMALGRILNGDITPSGHLVDTYARDFKNDPTWNNFSNNLVGKGNKYLDEEGKERNAYFVHYTEGIYVGYRYYETRGFTDGETWYKDSVVYPFGYGLSYTQFTWEISSITHEDTFTKDDEIKIVVDVTNIGDKAGKDVVQLYYEAPYTEGEIEKSHVVLGDFAKTPIINSQETKQVTLSLNAKDMASYDYNDANNNGIKGYELDKGEYNFYLSKNAHEHVVSRKLSLNQNVYYEFDDITKKKVANLFDDVSKEINTYLSRSDWEKTWPGLPSLDLRTLAKNDLKQLATYKVNDKENDPWYSAISPNQSETLLSRDETKIKLYDLIKKDYDDKLWDELLDQLTVSQLAELVSVGNYHTQSLQNIDKPETIDADGPMGFSIFMGNPVVYETCYYASESLQGATYNVDLLTRFGEMIGNESIVGNKRGDGTTYSGWYAPAVNLHRSQFSGRNFEYYSEDSTLSGKLATGVIKGASSRGVYTYLKHFALNEQETNRDTTGLVTWANEQSMRELYFKPFEIAVKQGKTTAMMSSFNRIGFTWAGGSYELLTTLLREEWGFKGMVITDYNLQNYMDLNQMIRAGGDLNLSQSKSISNLSSPTTISCLRKASKNILYTVANSNAMNGFGEGVEYYYAAPIWFITMWSVIASLLALFIGFGGFIGYRVFKTDKNANISGIYLDGTPYVVIKEKKEKTYHFSKQSIIYIISAISLVAIVSGLSIGFMAKRDGIIPNPPVTSGYIESIELLINHKEINGNSYEINIGDKSNLISVNVDTYGEINSEYILESLDESIIRIDESNHLIPVKTGKAIIRASIKDNPNINTSITINVVDYTLVPDNTTYNITIIGGISNVIEAKKGELVILTPLNEEDTTLIGWESNIEGVIFNGNSFIMPASDVTITALFKYPEFKVTLIDARFKDGEITKLVEATKEIPEIEVDNISKEYYQGDELIGFIDQDSNFYSNEGIIMPKKDISLRPYFGFKGTNHSLATGTRNYEGGAVNAKRNKILNDNSTVYTIPEGKKDYYFDIMNLVGSTDGFEISLGDERNLVYTFINHSEHQIDFTYDFEVGTIEVLLEPHQMVTKTLKGILEEGKASPIRPYHHLTLNQDLNGQVDLEILGYEYDYYNVTLEGAKFSDETTSKILKAGVDLPEYTFTSTVPLENYEILALGDSDGKMYQKMAYKDLVLSPKALINGKTFKLSTGNRRYHKSNDNTPIKASLTKYLGEDATEYVLPIRTKHTGTGNDRMDIMNNNGYGFTIKKGEVKKLLMRFKNNGTSSISFAYDTECATPVEITLAPQEEYIYVTEIKNDNFDKDTSPYHHLWLLEDLKEETPIVIQGYLLDESVII